MLNPEITLGNDDMITVHVPAVSVLRALARRCSLHIRYTSSGETTERCIEPMHVVYNENTENYNLLAWCRLRQEWRYFNLANILSATVCTWDTELQQPIEEEVL